MAKPRMAGDKLNEPTKESAEAKEALSSSERNKQIREEIGNNPERMSERISGVDREQFDFDGYSDKEINMAMQGESFGEKDYARLTGQLDSNTPEPEKGPEVSIPTPTPEPEQTPYIPAPSPDQGITGGSPIGGQNINQDNDITSNVTGDNNNVTNTQDNSIGSSSSYGGSDRAKMLRDKYVLDVSRFARAS